MTPLRILMTLDAVGGVWRYAMDLGTALAAGGHKVVFAGLGPVPSPAQRQEAAAVGTLEWGDAPLDWMAPGPEALSGVPGWLDAMTRAHRPDLLHLNLPSQAAGLRGGPPRIVVAHSCLATWFRAVEDSAPPDSLAWQASLTRDGLRNACLAVAPSAAHAALTQATYTAGPISAVHNGSRSQLSSPTTGDGCIVAVARWWDRAKNGDVLDRAAKLAGWPVDLLGSCEGPGGQAWTPRCATANGALPHRKTMARIAAASLFVSPSLYEPFGLAALEAARAARPLLLADIPVYRELWHGAARFFNPRDPDDLAQAIDALMRTPVERRELGATAQQHARNYSLARQAETMTDAYR